MAIRIQNGWLHVSYKGKESQVSIEEIKFIEAEEWRCRICAGDREVICAVRLGELHRMLGVFGFLRCHKGYLVNPRYIVSSASDSLILQGGARIPIGRTYRKRLKAGM